MNRPLLAVFLACLLLSNLAAQNLAEEQRRIGAAVEAREYATAVTELRILEARDEKAFVAANYDYLLARMAEADGDLAVAMIHYQEVAARESILKTYALAHLARIARSTGNLMLEQLYLHQLLMSSPDSMLIRAAVNRLARSKFEAGNYGEAIRIISSGSPAAGKGIRKIPARPAADPAARENSELIAEAYLQLGRPDRSRDIFNNLIATIKDPAQPDDVAESACLGLDLLDGGADNLNTKAPDITESEHLRRANVYRFNRNFLHARLHYEAVVANSPMGVNAADTIFQIGRIYVQQSDFAEAAKWFERIQEQFPSQPVTKDALLQAASAYARVGKSKEAIKRYQKYIETYPTDEKADRAYLNIVDILRDQGAESDAIKWCGKTEQAFAGKLPATLALFAEARIYIAREDWLNAIAILERLATASDLGGASSPGGTTSGEVIFLKGFAFEQLSNYADAVDAYLSIGDGRDSYYGGRASQRLKMLSTSGPSQPTVSQKLDSLVSGLNAKDPDERRKNAQSLLRLTDAADRREKALTILQAAIKVLPKYQGAPSFTSVNVKAGPGAERPRRGIADALEYLGLYDEAAPELEAAALKPANSTAAANSLALAYKRGDRAGHALAFVEPIWRKMPPDYPIELIPRDQLELLYPAPYADVLRKSTADRSVDPRFLLAIMRQESGFRPDAKSNAAARGLMQFIPATSNKIATELGRDNFRQDDIYYPPTAIQFGTRYISDLFNIFPGQPEAVAASYNAGEDNMARWLARSRSGLPERYVPEIVYSQSKDYVYKVMANYRIYQLIYDENLRPR